MGERTLLPWVSCAGLLLVAALLVQGSGDAPPCDLESCSNSTCRCSSTQTPGDIPTEQVPQFVLLSFDDAVTLPNFPFYETLTKFTNPNGCQITMTFFVSHENTDYTLVNKLHRWGHEIATHSVSHKSDIDNYWDEMTAQMWTDEIMDMKTMLGAYGNIPLEDVKGFRVPFLEVGGNLMYETLAKNNFKYDCSWPTLKYTPWFVDAGQTEPYGALWPYTLDYFSIQEETLGTKPTESYPGLWLNPLTDMQDNRGMACPMLDGCQSDGDELETSASAVAALLKRNFNAHYYGNRTPFGLYVHHSWFMYDDYNHSTARRDGYEMFLQYLQAFTDVYVASVDQAVEWTKNPVPLSELDGFKPLQCNSVLPPNDCPEINHINCKYEAPLPIQQQEVYTKVCEPPCPANYPWVGNPYGE